MAEIETLTSDMQAQLAILYPEVRGLTAMSKSTSFSAAAMEVITSELAWRSNRVLTITAVLGGLSNLLASGYPDMPVAIVSAEILAELVAAGDDVATAETVFATA